MAASWGVSFDRPTAQHGCVARVLRSPSTILRTCSIGYTCFETLLHVMGQCISLRKAPVSQEPAQYQGPCELERLPHQVFVSIIMLLGQQDLMQTVPLVCKSWHAASSEAMQRISLNLSAPERQQHLPYMFTWLQQHGNQLKQLQLSSSTPLGHAAKRALLRSLCTAGRCTERWGHGYSSSPTDTADSRCSPYLSSSSNAPGCGLQLQRLVLQMDLDVADLAYLAFHVVDQAPHLHTLKLEPLKPSLADLQLLVLACIVGNLVGADAPGPVLPHLTGCSAFVRRIANCGTQLRSLSLSRYDLEDVSCVSAASQLTNLSLQHCSLTDDSLQGLSCLSMLQRLELSDNSLSCASLKHMAHLQHLTHLDVSVMPSRSRMRHAFSADIRPLARLSALCGLNIIGFGVADVSPLSQLQHLHTLEAGLNPLSRDSLKAIGQISALRHLELGGVSQAWMLSSGLPPDITVQGQQGTWHSLHGLNTLTYLDLGGSHFSAAVWVAHMCPLLSGMTSLQRLMLAHCSIPPGKMQYLLPTLTPTLVELNMDRCPVSADELCGLRHLTGLTRLSAAAMVPELDDKAAALLATLTSLQHLVVRSNAVGARGAQALAKGLTALTCLDLTHCPIGRRMSKQLAPLMAAAEERTLSILEDRCF